MTIGYTSPTTHDYHGKSMSLRWLGHVVSVTWKYATIEWLCEENSFDGVYRNTIFPDFKWSRLLRSQMESGWEVLDQDDAAPVVEQGLTFNDFVEAARYQPQIVLDAITGALPPKIQVEQQQADDTEPYRRARQAELNAEAGGRQHLEDLHGQVWSSDEVRAEFEVIGFAAPFVIVRRLTDNIKGTLEFQHSPRFYFGWQEDK